jgi:thioredoxin-like negative regulator of GroEL
MAIKTHHKSSHLPQYLIFAGVVLIAFVLLVLKDRSQPEAPASTSALPQAQLERALSASQPALAFFHSNNCEQCIIMIETVDQVYPEFAASIDLVDVNVYDPKNEPLLQKVRLQYIPTLVFFDKAGQAQTHVGVMEADTLRQRLSSLSGAQ